MTDQELAKELRDAVTKVNELTKAGRLTGLKIELTLQHVLILQYPQLSAQITRNL